MMPLIVPSELLTPQASSDHLPIKGWAAIIYEPDTPRDEPQLYICPTIWPDRYEAVKVYGEEKIAAFVKIDSFYGDK